MLSLRTLILGGVCCGLSWNLSYAHLAETLSTSPPTAHTFEFIKVEQIQEKTISGQVTDATDGSGLPGVNILVKGTTIGTVTDLDGNYRLSVPDGTDTLAFSSVGYVTQNIAIGDQTEINVQLSTDVETLSEVVVVGYGTQRKSDLTGAVSQVSGEQLQTVPSQSPVQGLQGRVAGVQVTSSSGAPGAAPFVRIRGTGTLNDASPLFVVDGVLLRDAQDINYLNSSDIASVDILKDASATAIYGARGANGVVIITTKQGEQGATKVNVNVSYGLQTIPDKIDLLNGPQFRQLANEIDPATYPLSDDVPNTDWQDLVFKDVAGLLDANLSISGGSKKVNYYIAGGYFGQQGVIPESDYQRFTLRLNNTYHLTDHIDIGHNVSVARYQQNQEPGGIINLLYRARPDIDPYTADGNFAEVPSLANPLATIAYNNNELVGFQGVGNLFAEATFLDDFTFRTSFGISAESNQRTVFTPVYFVSAQQQNPQSDLTNTWTQDIRWFWENTLSYNKELGVHSFNGVVGYTLQSERNEFLQGLTRGLLRGDPELRFVDLGQTDEERTAGNGTQQSIESFLFRANYTYDTRYLLTVTGRLDGSSVFGTDNRYGFFPSVGLGWNIINESFLQDNNWLSNLKLRGSWGITGNDRVGPETRFQLIDAGLDAVFGANEALVAGATVGRFANENLRWEETTQWDAGLEFGFLSGRLNAELDYYYRTTSGILVPVFLPGYAGNGPFVTVTFNAAEVLNRGIELTVDWRNQIGDFSYGISANGTTVYNEVLSVGAATGVNATIPGGSLGNGQQVTLTQAGQPVGVFYGYAVDGVFQNQQELDNNPHLDNQGVGDLRFRDINGIGENGQLTGQPDGQITSEDRTFIGSPIPDFIYGFSLNGEYKGFSLALDFQGQAGNEIYNGKSAIRFAVANYEERWLDRWTAPGTSNSVPRASSGGPNFEPSSFFIQDGDFLRLRTVTLGYTLPVGLSERLAMNNARVYLRGTNVFTLTQYTGYSPEISGNPTSAGIDLGIYPITAIYTVGVNLTF